MSSPASSSPLNTSIGPGPYKIPPSMYATSRGKVFDALLGDGALGALAGRKCAAVVAGAKEATRHSTDHEPLFRQESFFLYLFGVNDPDCYGVLDLTTRESVLFVPEMSEAHAVWCGKPQSREEYRVRYGVDVVMYTHELAAELERRGIEVVLRNKGVNTDSRAEVQPAEFDGLDKFEVDDALLHPHLVEARVCKHAEEIEVLRYINRVSSDAHTEVMRRARAGWYEYQLEALFRFECFNRGGARYLSYTPICGSGDKASILHYGHAGAPNDKKIEGDDVLLLDMGAEYNGYASDITRSFPITGKFTGRHRVVYEAVYEMQKAVLDALKPGVMWADMHRLAERVLLKHLIAAGIVKDLGKSIEELRDLHVAAVFFPHGLGHFMGIDTHDVGGYPAGVERIMEPGLQFLRTAREMKEGMCITVEPGCYFVESLIEKALADDKIAPHLDADKLNEYRGYGGVRIEDNVILTKDGIDNLTTVPSSIDEIEAIMASE